jgi:hypothetical protein
MSIFDIDAVKRRFLVAITLPDVTSSVKITHFGPISTRKRFRGKKVIDRRTYAIARIVIYVSWYTF